MHSRALDVLSMLAFSAPFLAIAALLVYYFLLRARWRLRARLGKKNPGFRPSAAALGIAFQFLQVIYRPSVANVVVVKQLEDADEDEDSDPENPAKYLEAQLKRIRRGEAVDKLVTRL